MSGEQKLHRRKQGVEMSKRYMVKGKRNDNGEWVEGYLIVAAGMTFISVFGVREPVHADCDTIEPVAVAVVRSDTVGIGRCPNCDIIFRTDTLPTKYCSSCGQHLDWTVKE
jgi:hypothetical protein